MYINMGCEYSKEEWNLLVNTIYDARELKEGDGLNLLSSFHIGRVRMFNSDCPGENNQVVCFDGEKEIPVAHDFDGLLVSDIYDVGKLRTWTYYPDLQPIYFRHFRARSGPVYTPSRSFRMGGEGWTWTSLWFRTSVQQFSYSSRMSVRSLFE
jgi:hypothetical protein